MWRGVEGWGACLRTDYAPTLAVDARSPGKGKRPGVITKQTKGTVSASASSQVYLSTLRSEASY